MDLSGKRVVVVGLGVSGVAAARLLRRNGATVCVHDSKKETDLGDLPTELRNEGIRVEAGVPLVLSARDTDLVVVSPGVPSLPELARAEREHLPIIGELELATRFFRRRAPGTLVAIGGTNGKSTVTTLVGEMFLADPTLRTFVGGNLGDPFSNVADQGVDVAVVEVSSFQLERAPEFRPNASVLLNVTPDHLDRYADIDAYADAKGNAFARQGPEDVAVVPVGDLVCLRQAQRGRARIVRFGSGGGADVEVGASAIVDHLHGDEEYPRREFLLAGGHNASNIAAAIAVASSMGVAHETIRGVLRTFRGLPHRTTLVAEIDGVRFYDDSKGTNVGATVAALSTLSEAKAVLIAGGRDKGGSYGPLVEALRAKGRGVVLIGEAAPMIAEAVGDVVPVHRATSMDDAVALASRGAERGDAVLLSPACSSFDMFRDYKHRGDEFVAAVHRLGGQRGAT